MELNLIFKSVIDADSAPIVICDLKHTVVYMNPSSIKKYKTDITGKSIKLCHNAESNAKIERVVEWFLQSDEHNKVFTYWNEKENKDVYMVALRDENGNLLGYYEKHEMRSRETQALYFMPEE